MSSVQLRRRRLIALVTPQTAPTDELGPYLAGKLPGYMVPDRFVAVEDFPLTGNGKIDRTQLATRLRSG